LIYITEISPGIKISGLSTLVIQFDFNQYIVDSIKTLPTAYYHKAKKLWECPICYLGRLLDSLTFLDDIQLKLLDTPENNKFHFNKKYNLEPLSEIERISFKASPFPHQLEAVDFLLQQEKSLLLDGCGVGKSLEMILFAETLKKRGIIDHCLVITGIAGLRGNWEREIQKFSTESVVTIGKYITRNGTTRYRPMTKRAEQLKNKIDEFFVLLNVESIRDNKIVEAIKNSENTFGLILFDEAQKMGDSSTDQFTNLAKLDADFKVAATGTLVMNNPASCRPALFWTGNDQATLTNFKSQYLCYGGYNQRQVVGTKNLEVLREEIAACSIRRTLYDVRKDIPPLTIDVEYLEMEEDQQKFYEAIKEGVKEEADKIDLKAGNLLALTTRLRQATSCPSVLTSQSVNSIKVERAFEYIQEITSQGEKVVVFSMFKEPLNQLTSKLSEFRFSLNTGDTPDAIAFQNMTRFQEDPNEQVFLATAQKCGTGFNLNSSMYLVFIDTPYTYALFEQCFQRVHRINNSRPAFIKVLACSETIDERVWQIVETKRELGEYLVDGIEGDGNYDSRLTDELRAILRDL
jgi:SWI/SNF-related matrix-associated actin-dependent regulator 1 of chromatin subfamily A